MAIRYIAGGQFVDAPSDWDYPRLAQDNGWSLRRVQKIDGETRVLTRASKRCDHASTDGTVACRECGVTASEFISAAGEWLHERAS